jgi:hypothetical protein
MFTRRGAGTIECLLSLVLFAIVALGLTTAMAGSLRLQRGSDRAWMTLRLALEAADSLRRVSVSRGCGTLVPGGSTQPGRVSWQVTAEAAGVAAALLMHPSTPLGATDTITAFLPC